MESIQAALILWATYCPFSGITNDGWLTPIILVLFALGSLIVFAQSSAVAPFIYTLV